MAKFTPRKVKTGIERPIGTHVEVQHDNFERALRLWKRKCSDAERQQVVSRTQSKGQQ